MARTKSDFLSAMGIAFQIFKAIVDEVLLLGGNDESIRRIVTNKKLRQSIAELIVGAAKQVGEVFRLSVDYSKSLADMIVAGKYGYTNTDITADHFPVVGSGTVEMDAVLVHLGRNATTDEVICELDTRGLRPATMFELLVFGAMFPEKQREFPIVEFGSCWVDPDGNRNFGYLSRNVGKRGLYLDWSGIEWRGNCRFLAVPK